MNYHLLVHVPIIIALALISLGAVESRPMITDVEPFTHTHDMRRAARYLLQNSAILGHTSTQTWREPYYLR